MRQRPKVARKAETIYRRPVAGPEKRQAMRADKGEIGRAGFFA